MEKATSVLAALDGGKLPATQQLTQCIDWLDNVGITSVASDTLTLQGRVLAARVREILDAYRQLILNKNGDNILQDAVWHLTEGDYAHTTTAGPSKEQVVAEATADIQAFRAALRALLSVLWSSLFSESSSLLTDFASFTRLSLADAAELVETGACAAKQSLREIETGVQKGKRTPITGRSKDRVKEEEADIKLKWEHGMDTVKGAGDTVIDATRTVTTTVKEKAGTTKSRFRDAFLNFCDRTQSDPKYREAINTIFTVLQKRLNQSLDTASAARDSSLASLIDDPTPEQHVLEALRIFKTLLERIAGTSIDPVFKMAQTCVAAMGTDSNLRAWFDEFFDYAKAALMKEGYARSEASEEKWESLYARWTSIMESNFKWKKAVEGFKAELRKVLNGMKDDEDLTRVRTAHARFAADLERGLVEAGREAETGLEALVERVTWFWQDLFRVYLPRLVNKVRSLPIPRTEYKDSDIEFVLENLDISSLNIHPSHVFIRNITDVDVKTTVGTDTHPARSRTAIGTLTRIKLEGVQLALHDVSFYYKDLAAPMLSPAPAELTGLLALALPANAITLNLQVRLIPQTTTGPGSREALGHFHVIETVKVHISPEAKVEVRESNHGVLLTMFRPVLVRRLREALEKALEGQVRGLLEWTDGVAWDVARRREVFEDTGVGRVAALFAALWSEVGRLRRKAGEGREIAWRATGTGVVLEQRTGGEPEEEEGEGERKAKKGEVVFAVGAEPQVLSGEKHGPLGIGAEPLGRRAREVVRDVTGGLDVPAIEDVGMEGAGSDVRERAERVKQQAKGLVRDGQRKVAGFRRSVDVKKEQEMRKQGWRSDAFDI